MEDRRTAVPVWAVYLSAALAWPVWAGLFVGVSVVSDHLVRLWGFGSGSVGLGLSIILAAVLSYALGELVSPWVPPGLWTVVLAWLCVLLVAAMVGLLRGDARLTWMTLSVAAPCAFAGVGFLVGVHRLDAADRSAAHDVAPGGRS